MDCHEGFARRGRASNTRAVRTRPLPQRRPPAPAEMPKISRSRHRGRRVARAIVLPARTYCRMGSASRNSLPITRSGPPSGADLRMSESRHARRQARRNPPASFSCAARSTGLVSISSTEQRLAESGRDLRRPQAHPPSACRAPGRIRPDARACGALRSIQHLRGEKPDQLAEHLADLRVP